MISLLSSIVALAIGPVVYRLIKRSRSERATMNDALWPP
jgi:hypothetical protein